MNLDRLVLKRFEELDEKARSIQIMERQEPVASVAWTSNTPHRTHLVKRVDYNQFVEWSVQF